MEITFFYPYKCAIFRGYAHIDPEIYQEKVDLPETVWSNMAGKFPNKMEPCSWENVRTNWGGVPSNHVCLLRVPPRSCQFIFFAGKFLLMNCQGRKPTVQWQTSNSVIWWHQEPEKMIFSTIKLCRPAPYFQINRNAIEKRGESQCFPSWFDRSQHQNLLEKGLNWLESGTILRPKLRHGR